MAEAFDAVVIGGGVVGAAVCRELTLQGFACLLLERSAHLVGGASSGNTGIACTASDVDKGTVEHGCLAEGTALNLEVYRALNLPHRPSGTIYCAYTAKEYSQLELDHAKRVDCGDRATLVSVHAAFEPSAASAQAATQGH